MIEAPVERGEAGRVERRRDLDHVGADQVEAAQRRGSSAAPRGVVKPPISGVPVPGA